MVRLIPSTRCCEMVIKLKMLGSLQDFLPDRKLPYSAEVEEGATVGEVFDSLGMPHDRPRIILVNSSRARVDYILEDGDTLVVIPTLTGG